MIGKQKFKRKHSSEIKHITVFGRHIKTEPIDERFVPAIEMVCSKFGCSKILSLQEKLSGERCINHPKMRKEIWL